MAIPEYVGIIVVFRLTVLMARVLICCEVTGYFFEGVNLERFPQAAWIIDS